MPMKRSTLGLLSLIFAGLIFGSFGVWVRLLSVDLSSYQQIAFRNVIALGVALLIIITTKIKLNFEGVSTKYLLLFGISFPIGVICYTLSVLNTTIMLSIFSFYLGSIFSSLLIGMLVFKEKLSLQKALSLTLVVVGFSFFAKGLDSFNVGILLGIVGGLFDVVSNSFRKHLSGKINRVVLTLIPQIGGIIVATIFMIQSATFQIPTITTSSWVVGIIFGALLFSVNYLLLYGFQHFDLNLGTIAISSEVVFATLFGYLLFAETPSTTDLYGGLLIVIAIIIGNLPSKIFQKS